MIKNINKSKLFMIISICILCVSILGSTVAYYREELYSDDASTITYGLDYYINYAKGQDISGAELSLADTYTSGPNADIELWKKDNTYDIYGHIYLDINEIGTNLSKTAALKYTVVNNDKVISEGSLKGYTTGDSVLISANIPLQTSKQLYTIYIWLDKKENPEGTIESETLSLTARSEATMQPFVASVNLLEYISKLYTSNSPTLITQLSTNDNYYYAYQDAGKTWGLMNDGLKVASEEGTGAESITDETKLINAEEGNVRYFGPTTSVKNYIYFNCSDYDNQSDSTCEKWRIIGIVEGKVKIVKATSIELLAWDHDKNQDLSLTTYSNNWETASLQQFLNGLYYDNGTTTTLDYFSGSDGSVITNINLENISINYTTRKAISESTWYLGGYDSADGLYPSEVYNYERSNIVGTTIRNGNPLKITAKIGLMNASDYGFSANLTKCTNELFNYNTTNTTVFACRQTSWIKGNNEWLLNQRSTRTGNVWTLNTSGQIAFSGPVYGDTREVRPTLYLENNVTIEKNNGDGSFDSPYRIILN